MIHGHLIGIALVTILVERFVLDRWAGTTPFSCSSTSLGQRLVDAGVVLVMLAGGAIGTWLLTRFVLVPLGIASCSMLAFVVVVLGLAIGGEAFLARWWQFETLNRLLTRATIICSLLGVVVIVPWLGGFPGQAASFVFTIKIVALTGMAFVVVRILFDGACEKAGPLTSGQSGMAFARMLAVAALIALVLSGIGKSL